MKINMAMMLNSSLVDYLSINYAHSLLTFSFSISLLGNNNVSSISALILPPTLQPLSAYI